MTTRIVVPHLDANIIDVTVTEWLKQPGQEVAKGEIVAVLTTDKAAFELESPACGILLEILAAPKSVVPSGYILGLLGTVGESDPQAIADNQTTMTAYAIATGTRGSGATNNGSAAPVDVADSGTADATTRVRATPKARRLAREMGLDLATVQRVTGVEIIDEAALQQYRERD
ncbi:MAG: hypothetical protein GX230_04210 [Lentisphaerae bacterium]|nr:hypothetical protein [Lentisphaerota bacterium]